MSIVEQMTGKIPTTAFSEASENTHSTVTEPGSTIQVFQIYDQRIFYNTALDDLKTQSLTIK